MPLFVFLSIPIFPFTKVQIQINQLQKDSLGKSLKITLVSEFAILPQKLSKVAARKKVVDVSICCA